MDLLATPADLRNLLDETVDTLSDDKANVVLSIASGAVRAAARQTITLVDGETVTLIGDPGQWFELPQRPVTAVTSVKVDGSAVTDFKVFGNRLWRRCGWETCPGEPAAVEVVYSHGLPDWDDRLAYAQGITLTLAAKLFTNVVGATGMSIDDFSMQFTQTATSDLAGTIPPNIVKALRYTYGERAGLVGIG